MLLQIEFHFHSLKVERSGDAETNGRMLHCIWACSGLELEPSETVRPALIRQGALCDLPGGRGEASNGWCIGERRVRVDRTEILTGRTQHSARVEYFCHAHHRCIHRFHPPFSLIFPPLASLPPGFRFLQIKNSTHSQGQPHHIAGKFSCLFPVNHFPSKFSSQHFSFIFCFY